MRAAALPAICRRLARGLARLASRNGAPVVELPLLLLLGVAGIGAWIVAELVDWVAEGESRTFDRLVILALRNPEDLSDPLGPLWLEELFRDFTALGGVGVLVLITLASAGYLLLMDRRRVALFVVASIAGGLLASSTFKAAFDRPRPDLVPHASPVYSASFPSGHSMMSAITYNTLGALLARMHRRRAVKLYFIGMAALLTFAVGCSRIYLGVHWPTDVLAGWAAGTSWAIACWLLALRLQQRRLVESEIERT